MTAYGRARSCLTIPSADIARPCAQREFAEGSTHLTSHAHLRDGVPLPTCIGWPRESQQFEPTPPDRVGATRCPRPVPGTGSPSGTHR
jgi:hypothetical protein